MSNTSVKKVRLGHSKNLRIILLILFLGALFTVLTVYQYSSPEPSNSTTSSSDFRTIPLQDLDGNNIYVKDFEGQVIVLEFMATWCITCAQQEPILKELQSKYQSENVVLLSVSIEPDFDTPDVLKSEIAQREISWLVTRDTTLMMTNYFQVMELTTILIIAPDGEVKNVFKGLTDMDTLSQTVDQLI